MTVANRKSQSTINIEDWVYEYVIEEVDCLVILLGIFERQH